MQLPSQKKGRWGHHLLSWHGCSILCKHTCYKEDKKNTRMHSIRRFDIVKICQIKKRRDPQKIA